jgi:hypothetical protein
MLPLLLNFTIMRFSVFLLILLFGANGYTLADTVNIASFGLLPDSRINSVPYVQKALDACKNKPGAVVFFPKGRYDFWPHQCIEKVYYESNTTDINPRRCAILLVDLIGVTIDGDGSDFVFHDRMQPFTVDNSADIIIKKVSIDWDIPLTAEAKVVDANPDFIDIQIDAVESPYVLEKGKIFFVGEGWKSPWWGTMEFDRNSKAVAYNTGDWGCLGGGWNAYQAKELSPGMLRLTYPFKRLPAKGNLLVLRHSARDHAGIFLTNSRNVLIEDLNMYHNAGLGILSQYTANLTFRRVNSVPNPQKNRILSGHDDGLHFSSCSGQISVEQCRFHALMDDPINVHGTAVRVMEKVDDNTLVCKFMHSQSVGMVWARPGERIGYIENNSMITVAEGVVDRFEAINTELFKLHLVGSIPVEIEPGYALENLYWTPDVLIKDNRFESCRARGVLVSTPGKVLIENNVFESSGSAILIAGDANNWYESGGAKDVLIRNNHFTDQCLTSMYQFCEAVISIYPEIPAADPTKPCFHRNIRIESNHFDLYDYPVLYAKSVDNLVFINNTLNSSTRFNPWHPRKFSVSLEFCKAVTIKDNHIAPGVLGRNIRISNMKRKDLLMAKKQFVIE